jgi:hypothetical protein
MPSASSRDACSHSNMLLLTTSRLSILAERMRMKALYPKLSLTLLKGPNLLMKSLRNAWSNISMCWEGRDAVGQLLNFANCCSDSLLHLTFRVLFFDTTTTLFELMSTRIYLISFQRLANKLMERVRKNSVVFSYCLIC